MTMDVAIAENVKPLLQQLSECYQKFTMSQPLNAGQELTSDVAACQPATRQVLDVLDAIMPVEVREKISSQLRSIDLTNRPAVADPVTIRAIQKAIALIEFKFTPQGELH